MCSVCRGAIWRVYSTTSCVCVKFIEDAKTFSFSWILLGSSISVGNLRAVDVTLNIPEVIYHLCISMTVVSVCMTTLGESKVNIPYVSRDLGDVTFRLK